MLRKTALAYRAKIGEQIACERKNKGLNQTDLALIVGTSQRYLSNIELGRASIPDQVLLALRQQFPNLRSLHTCPHCGMEVHDE